MTPGTDADLEMELRELSMTDIDGLEEAVILELMKKVKPPIPRDAIDMARLRYLFHMSLGEIAEYFTRRQKLPRKRTPLFPLGEPVTKADVYGALASAYLRLVKYLRPTQKKRTRKAA